MIIHNDLPESKDLSNRFLVDASEKDAAKEMEIDDIN